MRQALAFWAHCGLAALASLGCAEGSVIDTFAGVGGSGGVITGSGGQGGTTSPGSGGDSTTTTTSSGGNGGGGEEPMLTPQACPPDNFFAGLDQNGDAICTTLEDSVIDAVNDNCAVFLGARDVCGNCSMPPTNWGSAMATSCDTGAGANNSCESTALGTDTVELFGLNALGDMNSDDKMYAGFHCAEGAPNEHAGPCEAGELVTGITPAGEVTCASAEAAALDYVRDRCNFYFGWRDSCNGCTSAPAGWGFVSTTNCHNGAGGNNNCIDADLGGTMLKLYGLNTGGDVNGDDKFYVGLHCLEATGGGGPQNDVCPPGQFVTAINEDGTLECEEPSPYVVDEFRDHCTVFFGWRDGCGGACTTAPSKYGRVSGTQCINDIGQDNACQTSVLGSETVELFGLNTDGDVDDNDRFYLAFRCE